MMRQSVAFGRFQNGVWQLHAEFGPDRFDPTIEFRRDPENMLFEVYVPGHASPWSTPELGRLKNGKHGVTKPNKALQAWQYQIRSACSQVWMHEPYRGPVSLGLCVWLKRNRTTPDLTNLTKAIEDCLKTKASRGLSKHDKDMIARLGGEVPATHKVPGVIADDNQVCAKHFEYRVRVEHDREEGVYVQLRALDEKFHWSW